MVSSKRGAHSPQNGGPVTPRPWGADGPTGAAKPSSSTDPFRISIDTRELAGGKRTQTWKIARVGGHQMDPEESIHGSREDMQSLRLKLEEWLDGTSP